MLVLYKTQYFDPPTEKLSSFVGATVVVKSNSGKDKGVGYIGYLDQDQKGFSVVSAEDIRLRRIRAGDKIYMRSPHGGWEDL